MAIAHDDDWCELTNGVGRTFIMIFTPSTVLIPHDQYDQIDSGLIVQLLRAKYSAASYYDGMASNKSCSERLDPSASVPSLQVRGLPCSLSLIPLTRSDIGCMQQHHDDRHLLPEARSISLSSQSS